MIDPIKFAQLVSFISAFAEREMDEHQIRSLLDTVEKSRLMVAPTPEVDELLQNMKDGNFIESIKCYRTLTKAGLKESKDAIERYRIQPVQQINIA